MYNVYRTGYGQGMGTNRTPRRADGESTVFYSESDGRWHGKVSMGDGVRRHVSSASKAEVRRKVKELTQARDAGVVASTATTVGEWLDYWVTEVAPSGGRCQPRTLEGYRGQIRNRIGPALGRHRLDRLQPAHVNDFYQKMAAEPGLGLSTPLQCHRILSRALTVAVQWEKVGRNVCKLVNAPRQPQSNVRPLQREEAAAVLAAARGERNAARWTVALSLGLRQGEALALDWASFDAAAGTLTVSRAIQRQTGRGLVFKDVKSVRSHRTIGLPDALAAALRAHRAAQHEERLAAGDKWQDHGLIFAQPNGKPIDASRDSAAWHRLLDAAGVPAHRLHDARHTAATLLLIQKVPARSVMAILGHSQIGLTLGTYSHFVPELQQDATDAMQRILTGE